MATWFRWCVNDSGLRENVWSTTQEHDGFFSSVWGKVRL